MNWKTINTIFGILLIVVFILMTCFGLNKQKDIASNCNRYTIGIIYEIQHRWTKSYVDYYCIIRNKKYSYGDIVYEENTRNNLKMGDRYFIKFCENYPDSLTMLFDKPVPDSIKEVPSEGWESIPR